MVVEDMPVIPVYFYSTICFKGWSKGVVKVPIRYPVITYADITK